METVNHNIYDQDDGQQLDALFRAYRLASPDPEPGPNFMPQLWQKIEARERGSAIFARLARSLVSVALALTLLMTIAVSLLRRQVSVPPETYVEVLAEDHESQNFDYFEPVHVEPAADQH